MGLSFLGKNLNECLEKASKKLKVPVDEINYSIVKESKNIFFKHCEIQVEENKELNKNVDDKSNEEKEDFFEIKDGQIILKTDENLTFKLKCDEELGLIVDDKEYIEDIAVNSKSIIRFSEEKIDGNRDIKINIKDNTAKIVTEYSSEAIRVPYCMIYNDTIIIKSKMAPTNKMPFYSKDEIIEELNHKNVTYGIIDEAVKEASSNKEVKDLVIAKGLNPIDDEEDKIKLYFNDKNISGQDEEYKGKIDYRNVASIANVKYGDLIAELIIGKEGKDGIDLAGKPLKRKLKKGIKIIANEGCKVEENKVIATTEGRPSESNGIFSVNQVLQVNEDVDMKSGNVKFIGDILLRKNIAEGMTVEAGNSVELDGNIEKGTIIANGNSVIKGSIINSQIYIGVADTNIQKELNVLEELNESFGELIAYLKEIQEKNLFHGNRIGEVIRVLIDTKCKNIPKQAEKIVQINNDENNEKIKSLLKNKIIGLAPSNINNSFELVEIENVLKERIEEINKLLIKKADLHINYVQDSHINVTGSVYIDGKGQYTSVIESLGDIVFARSGSVSRGGELVAKGDIKAKVLGSMAGVSTIVKVPKDKIITADIAYNNTTFFFGERKYTLETPSRNVKAYVDDKGEIEVEKLVL